MSKKHEQIAAFAFGVLFTIIMLTIALFVRNPTDFQYLVFRIVLALAAAGVAAMIPGFLEINVPNFLKAGGALAVFAVVYFYNPAKLVSSTEPIEPLKPPITNRTPKQSSSFYVPVSKFFAALFLPSPVHADETMPDEKNLLKVAQLLEGHSGDDASRIFDLTLSNASDRQLLLTKFEVKWRYRHGMLASVDRGAALVPIAKYIIDFPVDPDNEERKTFERVMYPAIALSPGTIKNPTLVTIRLQLHYHFAGRLDYHPCADWNILFDVVAVAQSGERIPIFEDGNWRWN